MNDIKFLKQLVRDGKMSRRDFLAQTAAMGMTAAMATSLLGGTARAATPKKGGNFRLGTAGGGTTDALDPGTWTNTNIQVTGHAVNDYLTEVNAAGKLVPELAESWSASDDAAAWTFKLRQGVEFHNGKTMDANDVIASINHHRGEKSKSAAKGLVDPIKEIKADGKNTVVFTLENGNADFPVLMSDYHLTIMPAKGDGADWQSGVGAGGYQLKSFEPGVRTSLTRHKNYWNSDRAHFAEVEVLTIADVVARTNALTTGEIDAMSRCDLKTVHLLKRRKGIVIKQTTGTQHYTIPMRTDTAPFDDNNVRLALKYAVDREALVKTILRGYGEVGNDHPIGRSNRYFAKDLPQRTYDPDKAKFYLKQAGLTSLTVDLSAADAAFGGAVDAAVLYKEHAAKAGIEINIIREPNDGYWSNVWMKKPWCMCYWSGRPTEDWMFATAYTEDSGWNDTFWKHERFNKIVLEARSELNEAKRAELYAEAQLIIRDEGGVVVPMYASYVFATTDKVKHNKMGGDWDLDGLRAIERWWFG